MAAPSDSGQAAGRRVAVLLISEDPLARGVLAERIAGEEALELIGTASELAEARAVPLGAKPDVVVLDAGPRPDAASRISGELDALDAPVLAIVPDAASGVKLLAEGALGAVLRDVQGRALAAAVQAVAEGLLVAAPEILADQLSSRAPVSAAEDLTPREREVLALLVEGLSNRLIAQRLGISEHTAKFHVNAVLQKLGAQTRTEAVVRAARLGLVTL